MKLKEIIWLMLASICLHACGQKEEMGLSGEWKTGKDGQMLYLIKQNNVLDSAVVKNGKFRFNLKNVVPEEYLLCRMNAQGGQEGLLLYLDNYPTYLRLTDNTFRSFGSDFIEAEVSGNPTDASVREVVNLTLKGDGSFDKLYEKASPVVERGDMAAAFVLRKFGVVIVDYMPYERLRKAVDKIQESVGETPVGKEAIAQILPLLPLAIGAVAPDFTLNTPEGKPVAMSEFVKGKKLVLIDFWASWCAPCRAEGKNVKAIYEEFHDKGFDVLGVSMDSEPDAWKKAIAEDGIGWTQVSNLKGRRNNPMSILYNFAGIPHLVLVDGEGRIVAKNVRGEELRRVVARACQ